MNGRRTRVTRRRLLGVGIGLAALGPLLQACAGAAPTQAPPKPAGTATPAAAAQPAAVATKPAPAAKEPAAAGGTAKVTLWHPWSRSIGGPYLDEIVARFNQQNSGKTQVEPEYITNANSELDNRIIAAIAANDPPNIGWSANPRMAKTGKILALDPLVSRDKLELDQFPKGLVENYQYGGKLYGLPIELSVRAIWLNKPLFEKAKVPYPKEDWTWDDYFRIAKELTERDGDRITVFGSESPFRGSAGSGASYYLNWLWPYGGDFFNKDETAVVFNSDAGVAVIDRWVDMANKSRVTPPKGTSAGLDAFQARRCALFETGPWQWGYWIGELKLPADTQVTPRMKLQQTLQYSVALWLFNTTEQRNEAAWQFLRYFFSKDVNAEWGYKTGYLPVRKDSQETPEYKKYLESTAPQMQAMIKQLQWARTRPGERLPNRAKIEKIFGDELMEAMNERKTPKQALDDAAKAINGDKSLFEKIEA
ncbi:MAG: ABC transporter substrate-binding protein [Chloroflexota bacterium]|nr:MAG: ABC transporter substrate-binding protein [Chloroflexota bacterium]